MQQPGQAKQSRVVTQSPAPWQPVLVSVVMTLFEFTLHASGATADGDPLLAGLELVNDMITIVFVVELSLGYEASL